MSASENEVESPDKGSAVRRDGRGPVVGVIDGKARAVQSDAEERVEPAPADVEPAPAPVAHPRLAGFGTVVPFLVGGLSGAVMAIVTVFLITTFRPALDPRVVPMTEQLNGFVQQMYNLESSLRSTEVDLVRLIDTGRTNSDRITKQNAALSAALSDVTAAREELRIKSGPGSPVFGVATVQLAQAIDAGRPFESEWVNIFALTASEPEVRDALMPLVAMSRDGVATPAELRENLQSRATELGLSIGGDGGGGFLIAGISFLQTQLGIPIGFTAEQAVTQDVLTRIDQLLATGAISQSLDMFSNLSEATTALFADWAAFARQRETADRIVADLRDLSRERLSRWARDVAKN